MPFNSMQDPIAITVTNFTLLKSSEGPFRSQKNYNEPYIVSLAIDEHGQSHRSLLLNSMEFPKIRQGQSVSMIGNGHLVYGPNNPGRFVSVSILAMESDRDIRSLGASLQSIVASSATELGMGIAVAAAPGAAGALGLLKELASFVSSQLIKNGDDELFRLEGTFLRDQRVPYDINRVYRDQKNDYASMDVAVVPLLAPNGEGPEPVVVEL